MRKWNTIKIFLFYDGTPQILDSKITFLFTTNTLTPQFPAKYVLLSVLGLVLTVASRDDWKRAPSPQPSPPGHRKGFRPARSHLRPSSLTRSSDASGRWAALRWRARRRSWPTLPSGRAGTERRRRDQHEQSEPSLMEKWNTVGFHTRLKFRKRPADLSFVQAVVELSSLERSGPLFALGLIATEGDTNTLLVRSHVISEWFSGVVSHRRGGVGATWECVSNLVILGTFWMRELHSESRPIFRMQPLTSRKNRKAPHTTMIPFIHTRSLRNNQKWANIRTISMLRN